MRRFPAGLTLVELLIVLAVVSLLLLAAVPGFQRHGAEHRLRAASDALMLDLARARAEAIRENLPVMVCAADAGGCRGDGRWNEGWRIFADRDGDGAWQPSEALLERPALPGRVAAAGSPSRSALRFLPDGTAPGSNATIRFCDRHGQARPRRVVLANTGRVRKVVDPAAPTPPCPRRHDLIRRNPGLTCRA